MKRSPTHVLVVDTNIALSALLGRRTWEALRDVGTSRHLLASEGTMGEIATVLSRSTMHLSFDRTARNLSTIVSVVAESRYRAVLDPAAACLRLAVASRDGNGRDAHVLALAWTLDADIWSHDRDFAGTGWPSWSTANLRSALALGPSAMT